VDDECAGAVRERPCRRQLAAFLDLGQVLAMYRPERLDLIGVLNVLDDGGEFHTGWLAFRRSRTKRIALFSPKRRIVYARSPATVPKKNGVPSPLPVKGSAAR